MVHLTSAVVYPCLVWAHHGDHHTTQALWWGRLIKRGRAAPAPDGESRLQDPSPGPDPRARRGASTSHPPASTWLCQAPWRHSHKWGGQSDVRGAFKRGFQLTHKTCYGDDDNHRFMALWGCLAASGTPGVVRHST